MSAVGTGRLPPVTEADDDDLATQRFFLDLLLQPLDEWEGFQRIEQFGLSGYRYELNFSQYALAMWQYTRTPAFTGYLAEAQRNAIVKMTAKRVWRYWAIENLVFYGRWNPDPVVFHNIMYSGYFGMMIGLYETLNDDRRFSAPGALELRWDRRTTFPFEYRGLVQALRNNMMQRPEHPQFPCEPHLVYPVCNTFAMNAMAMHDRLHGTDITGDLVERIRTSYDRDGWRRPDGRFISIGTRRGRQLAGPMLFNDGSIAMLLNPTMPDFAADTWEALRSGGHVRDTDGDVELRRAVFDRMDAGNYNLARGDGQARSGLLMGASEQGDDEAATALERSITERHEPVWSNGARKLRGLSPWSYGSYALGRWGRRGAMRDLVNGEVPPQWRTGPVLAEAAYPDVLVARAVSDGSSLDLVLRAGDGPRRTTLRVERLRPDRSYRVTGAVDDELTASASGAALITVDLAERSEVRLCPAA